MRPLLLTIIAALVFTTAASADPVGDLRAAGYTVGVAGPYPAGCTTYSVIGHGIMVYVALCSDPAVQATVDPDAQAAIASWTNPSTIYEADWQANHPDQVTAAGKIGTTLCYSITRTAPATDSWIIVGGGTNVTSSGAGLVNLAGTLPNVCGQNPAPIVSVFSSTNGTTSTSPGASSTVAAITQQAQAQQQQQTTTTTQTTTTAPPATTATSQSLALFAPQTLTVTVNPNSPKTIVGALSKSAGSPVVLNASTHYLLRGARLTLAKFQTAFKTHHRVKITGTRRNGKLVASTVILLV